MEKTDIRRITVDDVWPMLLKSWDLVKFNYGLTLVICIVLAFGAFLSSLPIVGALIGGLLSAYAPLVFLKAAFEWENGRESDANELIATIKSKELFDHMFPLIIIQLALYAAPVLIAQIPFLNILFGWIGFFTFPITCVVGVAYPILYFNRDVPYQKSLALALDGIIKNIGPFLVGLCILVALLVVSTILLVIPLFLVGLPVLFVYQYIWYRVIYENLTVEVPDKAII